MDIFVPDIGTDEVEITELLVAVGDMVTEEQALITVEGDKASMEVPAPAAGKVAEIKVNVGDKVTTGSFIMVFEAQTDSPATTVAETVAEVATTTSTASQAVHVPDIGGDEVEVTEMLVAVGDTVAEEQALFTVEGDKASMEVPAPFAGTVSSIDIKVGDKVSTGQLVMHFGVATSTPSAVETAPVAAPTSTSQTIDLVIPDIGGDEVEVTEVLVAVGDSIAEEQALITVEGDKASMEVPASTAGKIVALSLKVGDKVATGTVIGQCEVISESVSVAVKPAAAPATQTQAQTQTQTAAPLAAPVHSSAAADGFVENDAYAHASPVIRRLAREFGVNLAKVKGSGRKGRVVREDVQAYIKQAVAQVEQGKVSSNNGGGELDLLPWPKVDFAKFGEVEVEPLSRIKKISGANLHRNWVKIPHVTQFDEADITELEAFRKAENAMAAKLDTGVKITPLVLIMKAVAKSLRQFPTFNASLSEDGESLVLKKYVHIGIAVDTPNGLVVPVIRDVDQKGVHQLSQELIEVSKKARNGKLTAADMQGGCFSISSLGGLGGTAFTPIVNAPEVAILGVSKTEMKPKWNGKDFEPRLMLPLSLSYDHRVIDGALAAKFTTYLGSVLADLRKLIL